MARGLQQLGRGMAALYGIVGESLTVNGATVTGIRADVEQRDPLNGIVRELQVTVERSQFTTLPSTGARVQIGGKYTTIEEVRPGPHQSIILVLKGTV